MLYPVGATSPRIIQLFHSLFRIERILPRHDHRRRWHGRWVSASSLSRRGTITVMKPTSLVSLIVSMIGLSCWAQQITVSPQLIAGSSGPWPTGDGGPAINAFLGPGALAWDLGGNLLVFDAWSKTIRKITPDGTISKLFDYPISPVVSFGPMRMDSQGNLYFVHCEYGPCSLSKFDPSGELTDVPSAPVGIRGLAIDASNNVYVAQNSPGYVWRIAPGGTVVKIAGSGTGLLDGNSAPALSANLDGVHSLAFDSSGNLLMAGWDFLSRLDLDGNVVQLAGTGKADGFNGYIYFQSIVAAQGGALVINEQNQILRLDSSGALAVYAGILNPGGYGVTPFSDGCALSGGSRVAIDASLYPGDIILDNQGRLYDADYGRIRRIDPDGSIRTIAGTGGQPHESPSGTPALQAILYGPTSVAADGFGNAFFTEPGANRVQEITTGGLFVTVAGTNSPPPGDDAACYAPTGDVLSGPKGVAVDVNGNVYISDTGNHRILRVSPGSVPVTIAGTGSAGFAGDGGPAIDAQLSNPTVIQIDAHGQVYFMDTITASSYIIRRIRTDGIIESIQTPLGLYYFALDTDGSLVLSTGGGVYRQIAGQFYLVGLVSNDPYTAVDPAGILYSGTSRLTRNCHLDSVQGLQGLVSADPYGNLFFAGLWSVYWVPPIPPPAADTPSPSAAWVYNDASNLVATEYIPPHVGPGCSFVCPGGTISINDSVTGNEILRIPGACLGPLEPLSGTSTNGQAPTMLSSTQVLFDGVAAPLLSVRSSEVLVVSPQSVASKSQVKIVVENSGVLTAAIGVPASPAVPGVFASGSLAAAINQDGSVGPDHPAPAGSIVSLFVTGAGATNPAAQDGVPPVAAAPLALPAIVQIGGMQAEVRYAGAAPGLLGVAQLNVVIPPNATALASVQISVGGITRNQPLSIVVQR
jgi:uncharacterized protein (TIGR03437 family)